MHVILNENQVMATTTHKCLRRIEAYDQNNRPSNNLSINLLFNCKIIIIIISVKQIVK